MKIGRNHTFSDLFPRQGDLHGVFGVGISLRATFAAVTGQTQLQSNSNLNSGACAPRITNGD